MIQKILTNIQINRLVHIRIRSFNVICSECEVERSFHRFQKFEQIFNIGWNFPVLVFISKDQLTAMHVFELFDGEV